VPVRFGFVWLHDAQRLGNALQLVAGIIAAGLPIVTGKAVNANGSAVEPYT
jgi:hypothetical protein